MKMFKIFLPLTLLTGLLFSQSIEANWQLGAAIVEYTYVVRDSASAEDATAVYDVTGSWPSSAAAAAGQGYTHSLVSYDVGDTITTVLVPLINETFNPLYFFNQRPIPYASKSSRKGFIDDFTKVESII